MVTLKKIFFATINLIRIALLPTLIIWFIGLSVYRFTWDIDSFSKGAAAITWPFATFVTVLFFRDLLVERIKAITEFRIGNTRAFLKDPEVKERPRQHEIDILIAKIQLAEDELAGLNVFEREGGFSGFQPSKESVLKKKLERLYEQLRAIEPQSVFLPKEGK